MIMRTIHRPWKKLTRGGPWSLSSISQVRKWFRIEEMVVKFSQPVIRRGGLKPNGTKSCAKSF